MNWCFWRDMAKRNDEPGSLNDGTEVTSNTYGTNNLRSKNLRRNDEIR